MKIISNNRVNGRRPAQNFLKDNSCIEPLNRFGRAAFKPSDGHSPSPGGEGRGEGGLTSAEERGSNIPRFNASTRRSAFTMMEVAISLAIIGIALVAIIGVLPIGMNVQQDNRQQTIIAQDASVLMDAIRNGQLGMDDLTNYVYAISNSWVEFDSVANGSKILANGVNGFTYSSATIAANYYLSPSQGSPLTNAANIIGLLSTPEFADNNGNPIPTIYNSGYSNHIVAYFYSMSGLAIEKPPQDNPIMQQDTFGYRVFCVNAPPVADASAYSTNNPSLFEQQLANNLHELRLTFLWPQHANGKLGSGRQTFRTMVAGQLTHQPNGFINSVWYNPNYYYYRPQLFTTNAP